MHKKILMTFAFISPFIVASPVNVIAMEDTKKQERIDCVDKCVKTLQVCHKNEAERQNCFDKASACVESCIKEHRSRED